jgi:hypothetical protein
VPSGNYHSLVGGNQSSCGSGTIRQNRRAFTGAACCTPTKRRPSRFGTVISGQTLSAPFPKYGRIFSTTVHARTTSGWHCWLAQSRGTRDHRLPYESGPNLRHRALSVPLPKYGRTSNTTFHGAIAPGWHCWLVQQCLRVTWKSGTGFRKHSPKYVRFLGRLGTTDASQSNTIRHVCEASRNTLPGTSPALRTPELLP